MWLMPVVLAIWETEMERIMVQGQPKQIVGETTPISKNNQSGLGCSSIVKHLPSIHEALGSIAAPKKKRQKTKTKNPKLTRAI
jgi:hypothetical protein